MRCVCALLCDGTTVYFRRGVRRWIFEAESRASEAVLRSLVRDLRQQEEWALSLAVRLEDLILPEEADDAG